MAKKDRQGEAPSITGVPNRDVLQRLNFLYQASAFLQSFSEITPAPTSSSTAQDQSSKSSFKTKAKNTPEERKAARTARRTRTIASVDLAKSYVRTMKVVGQKATVRMDPSVKRTLCRGCDAILIPGVSASTRTNPSGPHGQIVVTKCSLCGKSRKIPAPPTPVQQGHSSPPGTDVTVPADTNLDNRSTSGRKRQKGPIPRDLPLFERGGHTVFRGNEQT